MEESSELAIVLRAGALPAPVNIIENRTIGPSLGQDSIKSGVRACLIGLLAIVIFMFIYYGMSGLIADVALIGNFVVLLGAMAAFHFTLTLLV